MYHERMPTLNVGYPPEGFSDKPKGITTFDIQNRKLQTHQHQRAKECIQTDRWYEPPVSFDGLARTYRAAVHHSSPIAVKRNILTKTLIRHLLLSQQPFSRFVQHNLVFGNAYLAKRTNHLGGILSLEKYTRVAWIWIPTGLCSTA